AWITPQHEAGSVAYLWCVVQSFPKSVAEIYHVNNLGSGRGSNPPHVVCGCKIDQRRTGMHLNAAGGASDAS
ncbi:hypothetical protein, partial [Xanthomonas campestris]